MPDIVSNDELNALAAEYVLGTLDYEERKGASALLEVDHTFRGIVRIWERRFGELHLMVEAVDPDPKVWGRIRPKVAGVEQIPLAIPSEPVAAAAPEEPSPPADSQAPTAETQAPAAETKVVATSEAELKLAELAALLPVAAALERAEPAVTPEPTPAETLPSDDLQVRTAEQIPRGFVPPAPMIRRSAPVPEAAPLARKSSRGWMATAMAMSLVAVLLACLISAWRFFPEKLPEQLRIYSVLNLPMPPPPAPPPPAPPLPFAE